jgi:NAD+ diphosphatase
MEHGERVEDAVAREVVEESGVKVDPTRVRYYGCQPWPQPYSLMLGCIARVCGPDGERIQVDIKELEDARWFTRGQIAEMVAVTEAKAGGEGQLFVPPTTSVAGNMISSFAKRERVTNFCCASL